MSDNELLSCLSEGDPNAFEEIFSKYNAKVYNFILSTLFDKTLAKDLTQNVFLSVWEHRESVNKTKNFTAYIYTIARNMVYRQTEKMVLAHRYKEYIHQFQSSIENSTEDYLDYQYLEKLLIELIDQLPPSRREIFLLSRHHGLTNKEIAQKLSISEKTVETQITRSIHFLKKHIKPNMDIAGILFFLQLYI